MSGQNSVWAVIAAAGSGSRVGGEKNKLLMDLAGKSVVSRTLRAFEQAEEIAGIAVSCSEKDESEIRDIICNENLSKVKKLVRGGKTRQESVMRALNCIKNECPEVDIVLIHDGARPFILPRDIDRCVAQVRKTGACVIGKQVTDTIKTLTNGIISQTMDRSALFSAQTPQGFFLDDIFLYHEKAAAENFAATDDAALAEHFGAKVGVIYPQNGNMKLTTREDFAAAEAIIMGEEKMEMRTGIGYDVHRLVENRPLILCGVEIPHEKGLLGHSDADVAAHALIDAILGAAAMGDIGEHFPDSDERNRGASSIKLLREAVNIIRESGYRVVNCDLTIVCQRPKLLPYKPMMRANLAQAIGCDISRVSIKGKTTEGLGFEGREEGISCFATALLDRR